MKRFGKGNKVTGQPYGEFTSFLGEGLAFKDSKITGCGHLRVSCLIEGDVEVDGDVRVDFAGVVKGNVSCANLTVEGSVTGENINAAQGVTILKGGRVTANIMCSRLNIFDNSTFNGTCNMRTGKESIVDITQTATEKDDKKDEKKAAK